MLNSLGKQFRKCTPIYFRKLNLAELIRFFLFLKKKPDADADYPADPLVQSCRSYLGVRRRTVMQLNYW